MLKWRNELEDRHSDQSVWYVRMVACLAMLQLDVPVVAAE